jgi:hypothetical protein
MERVFFVGVANALWRQSFFKNFFVTGDYVVAGVNLRGTFRETESCLDVSRPIDLRGGRR